MLRRNGDAVSPWSQSWRGKKSIAGWICGKIDFQLEVKDWEKLQRVQPQHSTTTGMADYSVVWAERRKYSMDIGFCQKNTDFHCRVGLPFKNGLDPFRRLLLLLLLLYSHNMYGILY